MNGYDLPIQGYQGKTPHYDRPSYHGKHTLMQSTSLLVEDISSLMNGYDLPIQGYQGKIPHYA
ncbi:hypothetical protein H5410_022676 [Solanum commersonii]|uniref:Uncharacterized protein n=1 Tax=Solanum commersonii TaxID=4109 RepID=A0A9J5ZEQ6_SOLCO|nr:hypothetical protein H5410_022676 [Solanum commersonii]